MKNLIVIFILFFHTTVFAYKFCEVGSTQKPSPESFMPSNVTNIGCVKTGGNAVQDQITCTYYNGYSNNQYVAYCMVGDPPPTPIPPPTPTPAPTPQDKCASITGKSFWGSQKGNNPNGCMNGCSLESSSCGYVPPLNAQTVLTCKYTVIGTPCMPSAPEVMVGTPPSTTATPPPECANYYIGKSGVKVCMNPPPIPTWTPLNPTPPPAAPTPFPTDANGNPVLNPDGSSGSNSNPSGSGGSGGTGSGGTGGEGTGGGTSPGPDGTPNPNVSPGPSGSPNPSGSPSPSATPSGDVPDLPDRLYTSKESRSFSDVLNKHVNIMSKSPIINAATGYFRISVSGTCPNWVIPSVMGMPSIMIDQFCNSTAYNLYAIIKIVMLIGCSIIAFKIAILD